MQDIVWAFETTMASDSRRWDYTPQLASLLSDEDAQALLEDPNSTDEWYVFARKHHHHSFSIQPGRSTMMRKLCQRSGQCPWRQLGFESTKFLIKSLLISYKWINHPFVEPGVARLEGQG